MPNNRIDIQPVRMSQDTARSFILEYQSVIEAKGATQIVKNIRAHTGKIVEQKTIYNWLRGITRNLSAHHFNAILLFIATEHFKGHLSNTTALYMHQERIKKIGSALFDIYGQPGIDPAQIQKAHLAIGGWWKSHIPFHDGSNKLNFLFIEPVSGYPFSKFATSIRTEPGDQKALGDVSGLLFYDYKHVFSARGWSFDWWKRVEDVSFWLTDGPDDYLEIEWHPDKWSTERMWAQRFSRCDEADVDADTKDTFSTILRQAIPRGIGHQKGGDTVRVE